MGLMDFLKKLGVVKDGGTNEEVVGMDADAAMTSDAPQVPVSEAPVAPAPETPVMPQSEAPAAPEAPAMPETTDTPMA